MDRNLIGNHSYRLNEDASSASKMHIFVKLTDSCMKTIETFIKQNPKNHSTNKSTIKFNLQGGEISIPTTINGERKSYSFQISPENKTPEVFQCLEQINRNQLENCGLIEQRLNIHAQEDVYSTTREKVTEFQKHEELNKKQTKEIGESSKTILEKKTHKSSHSRSSTTTTSNVSHSKQRTIPSLEHNLSPNNQQFNSSERPLRERLIHLLAARTYRKPDLLLRLKHDGGIRDDEREQLDSLLSSISTLSKTGELIIFKSFFTNGEINPDWPFYPKVELPIVKRKVKEHQTQLARASTTTTTSKTTNSNRLSLPQLNSSTTSKIPNPKLDEKNLLDNSEVSSPLTDERMQQLSDMLNKLNEAIQQTNSQYEIEEEGEEEEDLDEVEREYNRLVPEYNQLISYLQSVSEKFQILEQQFNEDQSHEKASEIVNEFIQCENEEGFLIKRQRLTELHLKLVHLKDLLEKNSSLNILPSDDHHHQ